MSEPPGKQPYWTVVEPVWDAINIYDGPADFLLTYERAEASARLLFATHFCQSEVRNRGFRQFFYNSTGVLAPEAAGGYQAVGQPEVAKIVLEAMAELGPDYSRDRDARRKILDSLGKRHFDPLDKEFYELIDTEAGGFEAAADRFAAQL